MSVEDVIAVGSVCKLLNHYSNDPAIWYFLYNKHILPFETSIQPISYSSGKSEYAKKYPLHFIKHKWQLWQALGNLPVISFLAVSGRNIKTIPRQVLWFENVSCLNLYNCKLESISPEFCKMHQLRELCLNVNCLSSLPQNIGNLSGLVRISLSHNKLKSIPSSIGSLSNLEDIDVSYNKITDIPSEFFNLTNLRLVNFCDNKLTSVHKNVENLVHLRMLWLGENKIKKLPPQICNLKQLYSIVIYGNELKSLPNDICCMPELERLDIRRNYFGKMPKSLRSTKCFVLLF